MRDDLTVRRVAETRHRAPVPGGGGTYTERYELMLLHRTRLRPDAGGKGLAGEADQTSW